MTKTITLPPPAKGRKGLRVSSDHFDGVEAEEGDFLLSESLNGVGYDGGGGGFRAGV